MNFLKKSRQKKDATLLFDIGSASIGAALVEINSGNQPNIQWSARAPIGFERNINAKRFLNAANVTLAGLCERLHTDQVLMKKKPLSIRSAVCLFSSPWLFSRPITLHHTQKKPFAFTEKLVDQLIQEEQDRFNKTFQKEGQKNTTRLIESTIIGTLLNGYPIAEPKGQHGSEATIHSFFSSASEAAVSLFEKTIHTSFHVGNISFSSFLLAYFSAVRDIHPPILDFICLDVTGEVTDVLVSNRGVISHIASFPLGARATARAIIDATQMPEDSALSVSEIAAQEGTSKDQRVSTAFLSSLSSWKQSLEDTLASISTGVLLPKTLFVTIDKNISKPFFETLKAIEHDALGVSKEHFDVVLIGNDIASTHVTLSEGVQTDPFLMIGAAFLRKIMH